MVFYLINEKQRKFPILGNKFINNFMDHRQNQKEILKHFYKKTTLKIR